MGFRGPILFWGNGMVPVGLVGMESRKRRHVDPFYIFVGLVHSNGSSAVEVLVLHYRATVPTAGGSGAKSASPMGQEPFPGRRAWHLRSVQLYSVVGYPCSVQCFFYPTCPPWRHPPLNGSLSCPELRITDRQVTFQRT